MSAPDSVVERLSKVGSELDHLIESWEAHGTVSRKFGNKDPLAITKSELNKRGIRLHGRLDKLNDELFELEQAGVEVGQTRQEFRRIAGKLLKHVFGIDTADA